MLSGTIPQCLIENCTETLGVLNLGNNSLSGTISGTFPLGCVLKTLDLNGNHLEGHVPESLSNCTMLEVLNLGSNKMNGNFTCFLKNLSNLRVLVLRSNSFQGGIRCPELNNSTWRSWQKLQIIDIASNNFSGHLPSKCFLHWDAMMIGRRLGFGIGAGFAVGPLVFWKQGSRWCDEQIEEYVLMIGPTLSLIFSWCGGVKVDTEIDPSVEPELANVAEEDEDEDLDSLFKSAQDLLKAATSGTSDSGLGSTSQSQFSSEEVSEAKTALRMALLQNFKAVAHPARASNIKKAMDVLVKSQALGAEEPVLQRFQKEFPDMVETDSTIEEHETGDSDDGEDGEEMEEEALPGRYCLFCSKLDIHRKKAVHDPNCGCHGSPPISSPLTSFSSSSSS
ncbi:hypothetical protein RHSIM_Rhsim05G0221200 [Rhododendron simsii]|uniref:Uncharacterized protein n=1 Tax=Rhododendron simsii TaxID=118357 RepID=A0A834GYG5_RHOSS|nr:hypothetical protein RHSIM_Rhsim05G0221200 [Rhododendron simsii]